MKSSPTKWWEYLALALILAGIVWFTCCVARPPRVFPPPPGAVYYPPAERR